MTAHKNIKSLIAVVLCIIFFPNNVLGENTILSAEKVRLLIEQQLGIVGEHRVFIFDRVFEDRENLVKREIIKTKNRYNISYKDNIYDCDDIAQFIDAHTTFRIVKKYGPGGAVILGTAFISCKDEYHALNIFVANKIVYIYDYEMDLFRVAKYLSKDISFDLILL